MLVYEYGELNLGKPDVYMGVLVGFGVEGVWCIWMSICLVCETWYMGGKERLYMRRCDDGLGLLKFRFWSCFHRICGQINISYIHIELWRFI